MSARSHRNQRRRARAGLSMLEATGATLMVGLTLIAALRAVRASVTAQSRAAESDKACFLATGLMTEITRQYYQNPTMPVLFGPEGGEAGPSRKKFNDVDDYNAWNESPPQKQDGTVLPDLNGWSRTVTVQWVSATDSTLTSPIETGAKRITVTVLHNNVVRATRLGVRTNAP